MGGFCENADARIGHDGFTRPSRPRQADASGHREDINTWQSEEQQTLKSQGIGPVFKGVETAAAAHGILRHAVGFDLKQLVAEFRALRATVLRLWVLKKRYGDPQAAYEIARFNEA